MSWAKKKIKDLGEVVGGGTPSTENPLFYGGSIPWITPKDLSDHSGMFIDKGERSITKIGLDKSSARLLPVGSVLFSSRAPIGYVAIADKPMATNQGFKSVICKDGIVYNKFLYYAFTLYRDEIESMANGSTFLEVSGSVLKEFEISIPESFEEQKIIAEFLSSLDDKIALNRQMNRTLEDMAQALFKRWFIDFEFPDQNGKPYKSSGGKMIESELGEIPEGWKVGVLGDAISNFDSKRIPLSSRERESKQGIYPYYGATSIMDYVDDYIFDGTYLLLGEDGSVAREDGKPFIQYVSGKFWVNNHAHVLHGKNGFSTEHIKLFLDQIDISPFVTGAVQPKLNQANMNSIPMIIADPRTLGLFNEVLTSTFSGILENETQTKSLVQIRDSLLPRLMSGKIRVKNIS